MASQHQRTPFGFSEQWVFSQPASRAAKDSGLLPPAASATEIKVEAEGILPSASLLTITHQNKKPNPSGSGLAKLYNFL
ncbi:hypothetical protein V6R21_30575 [Limibacter armeniacum]|uniref:hypothetical protein n=1 Tax=Limibacter armeniacum TaxID=466084 RepID=UPI002FE54B6D